MPLLRWVRRTAESVPLILISNREPFVHTRGEDGVLRVSAPTGGLTSALQPVMAQAGGTWVAWGSGNADFQVTDPGDVVMVPPEAPRYRLRRLRLSECDIQGYYTETANRGIWPLCHSQLTRFVYDEAHWEVYRRVNERFAAAAIAEARGGPAVCWVQDYQLALVPAILRRVRSLFVHQFWHIPWPAPDILRVFPGPRRLLSGLLGNHLLGMQTANDVRNFLACVRRFFKDAVVEPTKGLVRLHGKRTVVKAFPISIDADAFREQAKSPETTARATEIRKRLLPRGGTLFLGVDRADYTKGIPRRLLAFERLFKDHPELRGKVTLFQIAVPTRGEVPEYQAFEQEVMFRVESLNARIGTGGWVPVELHREGLSQAEVTACYRAADVCLVTPLQDGMNLVAKEFVACQEEQGGVLILSRFAGAAQELREALLVNPYDIGSVAHAMYRAIELPEPERERRMAALRRRVHRHTISDWMEDIFAEVARLRPKA
jgi:trehalose 6-phosphate synthase